MTIPVQLTQTLTMVRGDTKEWSFAVVDELGAAVNLTGASAFFTAKNFLADTDLQAVFQKTEVNGVTITAGSGGTGSIKLVPTDTSSLSDVRIDLAFDFQVKVGGNTYTPARGNLIVYPDITLS